MTPVVIKLASNSLNTPRHFDEGNVIIVSASPILLVLDKLGDRDVNFLEPVLSAFDVLVTKSNHRRC